MATVTRESIGELHDKLVVSLTKDDYTPSFQKALKRYGKTANIPGFRKGNVPSGMIRKMYGSSIFAEEVVRNANEEMNTYLKENEPQIFGQPLVMENQDLKLDMNSNEDINIAFEIGLKPEFEITALNEKGQFTRYKIDVTEEMLDKQKEDLRRRTGKVENPETVTEDSDMVYSTYTICDEKGNPVEDAKAEEDVVTLENLPKKLAEQVKGKSADFNLVFKPSEICDEKELETFMETALKDHKDQKDSFFKFNLTKVGRIVPSEMNEEFYSKVFPNETVKDEETFNRRLKEEIQKEVNKVGKDRLQNEIYEKLVHETPITLPTEFLKNWLKRSGETVKTDEEVAQEYPSFDHQLRWNLISDKLIGKYNLEVTRDEIRNELKSKVQIYFGLKNDDDMPWMDSYLDRMEKDEKTMNETYGRLLFDKLFDKIEEEIEVKEKTISEDEFMNLPVEHHHHH